MTMIHAEPAEHSWLWQGLWLCPNPQPWCTSVRWPASSRLSPSQTCPCKAGPWSGSPGQQDLFSAGGALTVAAVPDQSQHNLPLAKDLGAQSRDPTCWDTVGKH